MFKQCVLGISAVIIACLAQASIVLAQADAIDAGRVKELGEKVAARYELSTADGKRRFELVANSRLQWSKNTDEDVYGNVFIWTDQGVPAAVASIFQFVRPKDDLDSEFHSLSVDPIQAVVNSKAVWNPSRGGITFRSLSNSPTVAARKSQRTAQMRNIARRFRAERQNTDGDVTQLRFLSTPIFAYESEARGVLAGAIFAFVDQTDPEILLIIEAKESSDGRPSWHYAVARMNTRRLVLYDRSDEVYRAENYDKLEVRTEPYTLFQRLQDDPAFDLQ